MATITVDQTIPLTNGWDLIVGTFAMDATYATGGRLLDPALVARIERMTPQPGGTVASGKGYKFEFDPITQNMVVLQGDNTNAAAAPAIEVPPGTNLATMTAVPYTALVAY